MDKDMNTNVPGVDNDAKDEFEIIDDISLDDITDLGQFNIQDEPSVVDNDDDLSQFGDIGIVNDEEILAQDLDGFASIFPQWDLKCPADWDAIVEKKDKATV